MGYYSGSNHGERRKNRNGKNRNGTWRLLAAVALSGVAGSGLTMALHRTTPTLVSANVPMQAAFSVSSDRETGFSLTGKQGIVNVVKKVEPAVVGIVNYRRVSDFFSDQTKLQPNDVGSGVLINKTDKYGYFVTNNHVVQGAAKVEVVMKKGSHVTATVVGTDPFTDLAVVRVPASTVKSVAPIPFADSNKLQVGEPAIAIGSPMGLDFEDSVTSGIVSAKSRVMPVEQVDDPAQNILDYQTVIQTDAAINPGNSGRLCSMCTGKSSGSTRPKSSIRPWKVWASRSPQMKLSGLRHRLSGQDTLSIRRSGLKVIHWRACLSNGGQMYQSITA